jgi:membrane-associated protease RseP (regulator of RpoE activity)
MSAEESPPYPTPIEGGAAPEHATNALPQAASSLREDEAPASHEPAAAARPRWKTNVILFIATLLSVFLTGAIYAGKVPAHGSYLDLLRSLPHGWTFAVPLLSILLFHEFGHYFAARYHKVDASLPYFIPMPILSPFGTMGAVIAMRGQIKSRNALLDIGASGPLAGLVIALPVLVIGLLQSPVHAVTGTGDLEGQSLLYIALKRILLGPIPDGHDVFLSPVAFAGWTGMFITMLNLIPVGQLDGGHIAYALFGPAQNRYSRIIHVAILGMFAWNLARFMIPALLHKTPGGVSHAIENSLFWFFWFSLLHLVKYVGGRDHPPTEPGDLSPVRRGVAIVSLVLFILLFMPTPWTKN